MLAAAGVLAFAGVSAGAAHEAPLAPPDPVGAVAKEGRSGPDAHRGRGRHCDIAPDRLLSAADHPRLERLADRLDEAVLAEDLTQEEADRLFAFFQKKVTLKVARQTARSAPVLALFAVPDRDAFREAIEAAGGLRELMAAKGIAVEDVRAARREGRAAARETVRELCASGLAAEDDEKPPADDPATERPADPPSSE